MQPPGFEPESKGRDVTEKHILFRKFLLITYGADMLSAGTEVEHNEHHTVLISHSPFKTLRIKMFFSSYYYKNDEFDL